MKRNRYLLLLLGLLQCCPSLSKGAIIIPLPYPCHGRMPSLGDLEDIVQAQMRLSQQSGLPEPCRG